MMPVWPFIVIAPEPVVIDPVVAWVILSAVTVRAPTPLMETAPRTIAFKSVIFANPPAAVDRLTVDLKSLPFWAKTIPPLPADKVVTELGPVTIVVFAVCDIAPPVPPPAATVKFPPTLTLFSVMVLATADVVRATFPDAEKVGRVMFPLSKVTARFLRLESSLNSVIVIPVEFRREKS